MVDPGNEMIESLATDERTMDDLADTFLSQRFNRSSIFLPESAIVLGEHATEDVKVGCTPLFLFFCNVFSPKTVERYELDSKVYGPFVRQSSKLVPNLSIETLKGSFYEKIAVHDDTSSYKKLNDDERDELVMKMFNASMENVDTNEMDRTDIETDYAILEIDPNADENSNTNFEFVDYGMPTHKNAIILGLQHVDYHNLENIPKLTLRYLDNCNTYRERIIPIEKLEEEFYTPFMNINSTFFPNQIMEEFNGIFYHHINLDGISYFEPVPDNERDLAVQKDVFEFKLPSKAIVLGSKKTSDYLPELTAKYQQHRANFPRRFIPISKLEEQFYKPFIVKNPEYFPEQKMEELNGIMYQYRNQGKVQYYQRVLDKEMHKVIREDIQKNGHREKRPPRGLSADIDNVVNNVHTSEFNGDPG